jgi:hypothetical protein
MYMTMLTPAEFVKRASECERLAAEATNDKDRQIMLRFAASWRSLALKRELAEASN